MDNPQTDLRQQFIELSEDRMDRTPRSAAIALEKAERSYSPEKVLSAIENLFRVEGLRPGCIKSPIGYLMAYLQRGPQ